MFIALQFPIADIRRFLVSDTHRLENPVWPVPQARVEFVRQFGEVRERERGGIDEWPGEDCYCEASRALRFDERDPLSALPIALELRTRCRFRRLMHDGNAVARVEVGFEVCRRKARRGGAEITAGEFIVILRSILNASVRIPSGKGSITAPLISAGRALARHYLISSTRYLRSTVPDLSTAWMLPGAPLALVESGRSIKLAALPAGANPISRIDGHILLHHYRYSATRQSEPLQVWMLGTNERTNAETLRQLRLHLFRLHAENQCLRQVIRSATKGTIRIDRGSEASDAFQLYLERSLRRLNKLDRSGFPQTELLKAAQEYGEFATPGLSRTLLDSLDQIRGNVLRALERYAHTLEREREERPMYQLNFGAGSPTFHGDFVVAGKIQDSFNTVHESSAPSELKQALEDLTRSVASILDALPAQDAQHVASDLEALSSEATSPAPRRDWYELSAKGLVKAARTVGEVAQPIVDSVEQVLRLLNR